MKIRSNWSRVVSCGRADRRDETNSRFSQFCERALKRQREENEETNWIEGRT
jgi:hypothetical protein